MKKLICSGILLLGMTTAPLWAEDAMQAEATPGPDQPAATETQPEAKPVEVKLDKNTREAMKQEKAAQKQAEKVAQRQHQQQKMAQKAAQKQQRPAGKPEIKEKGRPFRGDFKSDFDQSALKGNLANAFKKYPEFRQIVEKELALEAQSRDLMKKFKTEKDAGKKAELEKQLRDVVSQHFDARQARRLFELKIFEDRIQELRKQTEDRNGLKERIVDKRMMELIGTDEDLRF
ncbi:MAG: hypothetical protein IJQ31_16315 [Thermoguttaceae bacterium]|nr:hypothetical protein [Thermoguttaceae bacterium]